MKESKLMRRSRLRIARGVLREYDIRFGRNIFLGDFRDWLENELGKISKVVNDGKKKSTVPDTPGT